MPDADALGTSLPRRLKHKVVRYAIHAGTPLLQKALWLYYAAQRPETPVWAKSTIYAALSYFIFPFDVIPDAVPIAGYLDDFGLLALSAVTVAAHITQQVKDAANTKLQEWIEEARD